MEYLDFLLETGDGNQNTDTSTTTGQDVPEGGDDGQGGGNILDSLLGGGMALPMIAMVLSLVVMWWFTSRSQKKKDKEAQDLRDSIQIGDEVTTIGGIIGKVVSVKDETFVLETTKDRTHIRFLKAAIRSVDVRIADVTAAAEGKDNQQTTEEKPKKKFSLFGKKDK